MSRAKTLLERLAELDAAVAEARKHPREVKAHADHAKAEAARIREELIEAFASADRTLEAKLTKARATAEARAGEPWTERIAGAERAANRLQAERDAWIAGNIAALLEEVEPSAQGAVDAITGAVAALEAARRQWHAVEQQVTTLIRPTSWDTHDVPNISGVDQAIRDLTRGIGDVPLPLPRHRFAATVVPEHDPDPEVRDAARARFVMEQAAEGEAA